ncbi:MAG: hypothetical protein H0U85_07165 [Gemmatimonadales bacterium]|nr:hypothetical protein [Gemmatimonadales bacterium]
MPSRGKAAALLVLVFLAGLLAGAAGMRVMGRGAFDGRRGPRRGPDSFVQMLTKELDLSAPQQDSVRAILARRTAAMDSMWREIGPRFETLKGTVRSDIRMQLTPDQQRKFAEMNKRFDRMRPAPGGPRGTH